MASSPVTAAPPTASSSLAVQTNASSTTSYTSSPPLGPTTTSNKSDIFKKVSTLKQSIGWKPTPKRKVQVPQKYMELWRDFEGAQRFYTENRAKVKELKKFNENLVHSYSEFSKSLGEYSEESKSQPILSETLLRLSRKMKNVSNLQSQVAAVMEHYLKETKELYKEAKGISKLKHEFEVSLQHYDSFNLEAKTSQKKEQLLDDFNDLGEELNKAYSTLFNELEFQVESRRDLQYKDILGRLIFALNCYFEIGSNIFADLITYLKENDKMYQSKEGLTEKELIKRKKNTTYELVKKQSSQGITSFNPAFKVFGGLLVSLVISEEKAAISQQDDILLLPPFLQQLFDIIRREGMNIEGIFRLPGNEIYMKELHKTVEERKEIVPVDKDHFVHSVASILKAFFRDLAEPLMTFDAMEELVPQFKEIFSNKAQTASQTTANNQIIQNAAKVQQQRQSTEATEEQQNIMALGLPPTPPSMSMVPHSAESTPLSASTPEPEPRSEKPSTQEQVIQLLKNFIKTKLPRAHQIVLKQTIHLLYDIQANSSVNKMTSANLAIIFSMNLFKTRSHNLLAMAQNHHVVTQLTQALIDNYPHLFDEFIVERPQAVESIYPGVGSNASPVLAPLKPEEDKSQMLSIPETAAGSRGSGIYPSLAQLSAEAGVEAPTVAPSMRGSRKLPAIPRPEPITTTPKQGAPAVPQALSNMDKKRQSIYTFSFLSFLPPPPAVETSAIPDLPQGFVPPPLPSDNELTPQSYEELLASFGNVNSSLFSSNL